MGTYLLSMQDLVDAINPTTFLAIFDDGNTGILATAMASTAAVLTLRRAHAKVISYLVPIYAPGVIPAILPDQVSDLLVDAALGFATALAYERHPDYVRSFGEEKRAERKLEADKTMRNIVSGLQRPAEIATPPVNAGGVTYNIEPRLTGNETGIAPNLGDF